jgi:hypothetical protein
MHQGTIRFNKGAMEVGGSSGTKLSYSEDVNKYSYKNNYKGKHPMTRTQWRRFQRQKKLAAKKPQTSQYKEVARRPAKERILPPIVYYSPSTFCHKQFFGRNNLGTKWFKHRHA